MTSLDDNKPIFMQIKEHIEEDILFGRLKPNDQIPSNSQLVSFYGINPVTVLKGVNMLLDEGLIYKKRGLGMYVSENAPRILQERYKRQLENESIAQIVKLAKPLGITLEDLIKMLQSKWRGNND